MAHLRNASNRNVIGHHPLVPVHKWTFPFQDAVLPGESGQGYVLRMAEANFIGGMRGVKKWLGRSRSTALDDGDAEILSTWFGAQKDALSVALGKTTSGRSDESFVYAGHVLGRSYFLNRSYPRVCRECLDERNYCRLAWDFLLVVACPHHQNSLVDHCGGCLRALSWNRLGVRTCGCGSEFESCSQPAGKIEIEFAHWVETHITRNGTKPHQGQESFRRVERSARYEAPLMRMIQAMRLDAGMHVAFALGTAARYSEAQTRVDVPTALSSLIRSRQILQHANAIAEKFANDEPVAMRVRNPSAVVRLLVEALTTMTTEADKRMTRYLMLKILSQRVASAQYKKVSELIQSDLFSTQRSANAAALRSTRSN